MLQLANLNNQFFSEDIYFDVIDKKTATLFSVCTESAALSMKTDANNTKRAHFFGKYLGICFQIKDDIFDYYDNKEIGKPTGNDMLDGRLTLPVIYALNTANNEWAKKIALKVKSRTASLEEINELTQFTKHHNGIEYAYRKMDDCREKAINVLSNFPLYNQFCNYLSFLPGKEIGTGEFGANMKVELLNDGPVTIFIDTKNKE
ncbi:Octaprenyl-diphosphate synthase [termite gut metagenome]|uniref:Octaprenyl-diphosphate synthase n=1 Tax=termite gut metagenome TaxID=433724 RepID=A0A5J4PN48_9ZZZZ